MAKNDYGVIVCIILSYMYECLKAGKQVELELMNPEALKLCDNYWMYIIRHLVKDGYIEGVLCTHTKEGYSFTFDDINITPKGIEYLQENSYMQKAKETVCSLANFTSLTSALVKMGLTVAKL